jgi:hypothetical protein
MHAHQHYLQLSGDFPIGQKSKLALEGHDHAHQKLSTDRTEH